MSEISNELFNPGERLRDLLVNIYPFNNNEASFASVVDDALIANGEIVVLSYNSTINYLLRRLITISEYIKRKYTTEEYPGEKYIEEIRDFLSNKTKIPQEYREKILSLLLECLRARSRKVSSNTKQRLRYTAQASGLKCYICGCDMDFEMQDPFISAIIEHVWPHSMGGDKHDDNLRVSCKKCSDNKAHYVDASDFHYEEICLTNEKGEDDFSKKFTRQYKIAIWAKNKYTCILCGKPASVNGPLGFLRRDYTDNWHFLNIDAYCDEHLTQVESVLKGSFDT